MSSANLLLLRILDSIEHSGVETKWYYKRITMETSDIILIKGEPKTHSTRHLGLIHSKCLKKRHCSLIIEEILLSRKNFLHITLNVNNKFHTFVEIFSTERL